MPVSTRRNDILPKDASSFGRMAPPDRPRLTAPPDFAPGQRWISNTETELGLGIVLQVEHRQVSLLFPATGESRTYVRQDAPLTRARFEVGDVVDSQGGESFRVERIEERAGALTYHGHTEDGTPIDLTEARLNHFLQLSQPADRLFSGQIDTDRWFDLRYRTIMHMNKLAQSDLRGLTGARTSLIAHQLYIAHEVSNRHAPRVLLADEVGLGKTIEAGLIVHRLLLTDQIQRVLIVVPETLVHQWLVEMLRRFNLQFSLLDEERCRAIEESGGATNVFHESQLVIVHSGFLRDFQTRFEQALDGQWDLLIVDEAHHLEWSPESCSPEYRVIEQLARQTPGVLLLTATPEQLGKAGHFARLRLLDPARFDDLDRFLGEEAGYEPYADLVDRLFNEEPLAGPDRSLLECTLSEGDNLALIETLGEQPEGTPIHVQARNELIEHLVDRHGTGRVLFRNTRAAVTGFPPRCVNACALPLPDAYQGIAATAPERALEDAAWTGYDPRVRWLIELLETLRPDKVLVIAADARTVLELSDALRIQSGIQAAIFHEAMSIIERDRAAAFFADPEDGSQLLICSEIGSEGRNFQFAHHMVLFDLPMNPDLLEQRIGRMDRIGQRHTIRIHVPYFEHSAQEVLKRWYQEGLDAFEQTCPAGIVVRRSQGDKLHACMDNPHNRTAVDALVSATASQVAELNEALQRGRDRLLEYNSCRPDIADRLMKQAGEQDGYSTLPAYMDDLCNCFGIDIEDHSSGRFILRPGDNMVMAVPGLPEDGMTITYRREIALAREDVHFISWDHPLVITLIDMVQSQEYGNTSVIAIEHPAIEAGTLLLETIHILEAPAVPGLRVDRYLPPTALRTVLDEQERNLASTLEPEAVSDCLTEVDKNTAAQVVAARESALEGLIEAAGRYSRARVADLVATARHNSNDELGHEIARLRALATVNPNVRPEEIEHLETRRERLEEVLGNAQLRLDALRVIVAT